MVLATSSIGAIWSSASPELGEPAILERFMQVLSDRQDFACDVVDAWLAF